MRLVAIHVRKEFTVIAAVPSALTVPEVIKAASFSNEVLTAMSAEQAFVVNVDSSQLEGDGFQAQMCLDDGAIKHDKSLVLAAERRSIAG